MDVVRNEKIYVTFTPGELLVALRRAYPNEFILKRLRAKDLGLRVTDTSHNLVLSQEVLTTPAELAQRRLVADGFNSDDDDGSAA